MRPSTTSSHRGPLRARIRAMVPAPLRRVSQLLRGHEIERRADFWDLGERLIMGRYSYGLPHIRHWPEQPPLPVVRVGNFSSISEQVTFFLGSEHPVDRVSTFGFRLVFDQPGAFEDGFPHSRGDIVIGNDVWIGYGARVLSGVTVGDGAVIGGGAVVSKDVRPYAIVVGNPAREVRRRHSDEQIEALLEIRWWDWPDERIVEAIPLLSSSRIDEFIALHRPGQPPAG